MDDFYKLQKKLTKEIQEMLKDPLFNGGSQMTDINLSMICITILALGSMIAAYFQIDVTAIFTHAVTAFGSLAIGRKLKQQN